MCTCLYIVRQWLPLLVNNKISLSASKFSASPLQTKTRGLERVAEHPNCLYNFGLGMEKV